MGTQHYLGCLDCNTYIDLGKAYDIGPVSLDENKLSEHIAYIYTEHEHCIRSGNGVDYIRYQLETMSLICGFLLLHVHEQRPPHRIVWFSEHDNEYTEYFNVFASDRTVNHLTK